LTSRFTSAVVCTEYGPPERLVLKAWPTEELGPDGIRVRVHAASVNFPDTLIIQGEYQVKLEPPFVPGFEVAGEVIEVGQNVTSYRVGDRLTGLTRSGHGGFAEEAITDSVHAVAIPDGMDYVTATAFYSSYGTSYHALVQRGGLRARETLLVLGAAGGVGLAAVEIGKALGARVIAAAGSAERLQIAQAHGADEGIDYRGGDLKARVRALTDGRGVDVCFDGVGGDAFDAASRIMNYNGRLLVVGFASGRIPLLATNLTLLKGYQVVGVWWNRFLERSPETNQANFQRLFELYKQRRLRPRIFRTYPLEQAAAALNDVLERRATGRLVLRVGGGAGAAEPTEAWPR
jgi:NADPH:quinone reductase